jgi:hypothetical protein
MIRQPVILSRVCSRSRAKVAGFVNALDMIRLVQKPLGG